MKRRSAVKGIILFSLGTGMIYSCTDKYKAIRGLSLDHFKPEDSELDLLEMLSDLVVPLKSISALKSHSSLPLMFTMLDDVYTPEERAIFLEGYRGFDALIENNEGKKFTQMDGTEQINLVAKLNSREGLIDKRMQSFFDIVKIESIRYFKTCEYYQRKVNYYEMAPGRFKGEVLIDELKNANEG